MDGRTGDCYGVCTKSERQTPSPTLESTMSTTIYLSTDASVDLSNAGERNTPASRRAFAAAWTRAATLLAAAAASDVVCYVGSDASRHHETRRAGQRDLTDAGIERESAQDILDEVWQHVHDCVSTSRPGRWSADASRAKRLGEKLATRLANAPLASAE